MNSIARISTQEAAEGGNPGTRGSDPQDVVPRMRVQLSAPDELSIALADGRRLTVHPLWLRERCRDAISMDAVTGQRLQDPSDLDLGLKLTAVTEPAPGRFHVRFSDGH